MSGNAVAKKPAASKSANPRNQALVTATAEIVTHAARTAAGELVKGQQPIRDVARTVASDAVDELEKRGPDLAEDAGILNWRYAVLGWITWNLGKQVLHRKAKQALTSKKGEQTDG